MSASTILNVSHALMSNSTAEPLPTGFSFMFSHSLELNYKMMLSMKPVTFANSSALTAAVDLEGFMSPHSVVPKTDFA